MAPHTTTTEGEKQGVDDCAEGPLGQRLLLEELLQDGDDAARLRVVAVLRPGVLQQHVPVSARLQELVAAKQGVVAHLRLPHEALQAVHVLDGLRRATEGEEGRRGEVRVAEDGRTKRVFTAGTAQRVGVPHADVFFFF